MWEMKTRNQNGVIDRRNDCDTRSVFGILISDKMVTLDYVDIPLFFPLATNEHNDYPLFIPMKLPILQDQ